MYNILDLSPYYTLIHVSGEKAEAFLQGQVTADIREISDTQTRLAAHCNPKGRVLSSFRVLRYDNHLYLCAPHDMAEHIIKQLTPYARLSKVLLDHTHTFIPGIWGIWGENAEQLCRTFVDDIPQNPDDAVTQNHLCLIRLHGSIPRFMLIGDIDINACTLSNDQEIWPLLEIQAGIASIHPETSSLFTPDMLNYPALNAVSFKKGCYIGQEIIARTHYLGKSKRQLCHINTGSDQAVKAGDTLYDDAQQEVGTVVNAALNLSSKHYECLAVTSPHSLRS